MTRQAGKQDQEERVRGGPQETSVQGVGSALWAVLYTHTSV